VVVAGAVVVVAGAVVVVAGAVVVVAGAVVVVAGAVVVVAGAGVVVVPVAGVVVVVPPVVVPPGVAFSRPAADPAVASTTSAARIIADRRACLRIYDSMVTPSVSAVLHTARVRVRVRDADHGGTSRESAVLGP
jgi:hypothetical protein